MKTVSGAITALALLVFALWAEASIMPQPLRFAFGSLQGFLTGADWMEHVGQAGGTVTAYLHIACGMWMAAMLAFLLGRLVVRPALQLLPAITPPAETSGMMKVLNFILPPPPPKTIKGRPALEVIGIPMVAFVHLLPPTGPWAVRVIIDGIFGVTRIPVWQYAVGALIGIFAHLGALATIAHYSIPVPTPPAGLAGLVAFFAPPIVITVIVRSILVLVRRSRSAT